MDDMLSQVWAENHKQFSSNVNGLFRGLMAALRWIGRNARVSLRLSGRNLPAKPE